MARRIRIVVGEGRTAQQGLLRFVLEGEGFDIVGEARGTADLASLIEEQRPDVVVLDDGIGVMAVSMVHEVAPDTKIVLVWPSAVVPIGGDARVEPAQILRDLGPAVEHVAAIGAGASTLTESFDRPDWIDRVRKDPATLRDKLETGKEAAKRPSVTQLQRRGKRLHPAARRRKTASENEEEAPAPVVVLPLATEGAEPVLDIGGGAAVDESGAEPPVERSEWNRRLGTLALSGAAAVSALVLALALGGGRIPVTIVRGGGTLPPGVPGFVSGQPETGPSAGGSLGGSGYDPFVPEEPASPTQEGGGSLGNARSGGDLASPAGSGPAEQPSTGGGGGTVGTGGGGGGTGGTGGGGGGTSGEKVADLRLPGKSADHNPHGGPPSRLGLTPAHGSGLAAAHADHGSKAAKSSHAHKH